MIPATTPNNNNSPSVRFDPNFFDALPSDKLPRHPLLGLGNTVPRAAFNPETGQPQQQQQQPQDGISGVIASNNQQQGVTPPRGFNVYSTAPTPIGDNVTTANNIIHPQTVSMVSELHETAKQRGAPLYGFMAWPATTPTKPEQQQTTSPINLATTTVTTLPKTTAVVATSVRPAAIKLQPWLASPTLGGHSKKWIQWSKWGLGLKWPIVIGLVGIVTVLVIRAIALRYAARKREEIKVDKKDYTGNQPPSRCGTGAEMIAKMQPGSIIPPPQPITTAYYTHQASLTTPMFRNCPQNVC